MREFKGYHGTLKEKANIIKKEGFKKSESGWLGEGVYFFEEDYDLCLDWAKRKYKTSKVEFIKKIIKAEDEKIFDITIPYSKCGKYYYKERKKFIQAMQKKGFLIDLDNSKRYEGGLIKLICEEKEYDLVRACTYTYQAEDFIYRSYVIDSKFANGIEISVRNLECIC